MSTEADTRTSVELPTEIGSVAEHRRRGLIFIGLAAAGVGLALHVQIGVNANFVRQVMGLTAAQQGVLEALRESWGIIALVVLALAAGIAEPLLAAGVLVLLAAGLGGYALVPTFGWLIAAGMVWSSGFHVWVPLPNSMTLALAEPGRVGHRLGQIRAAGALGSGIGLIAALVMGLLGVQIRPLFLLAGGAGLLAAAACLGVPRKIKTPGPRLVFRRKYALYYLLSLLEGWRKQIFVAFAGYLLVDQYQTRVTTILMLCMCIQAICWAAAPWVGRLIDRVGERPVLVFYYACLMVFFVGYATVRSRYVLYALFVADSAFFVFAIALTTYVGRLAPLREQTQTLSMGVAFNHVGAVAMPLVGGTLWICFGYQWAFVIGAAAAALSVLVSLRVPPREAGARAATAPPT